MNALAAIEPAKSAGADFLASRSEPIAPADRLRVAHVASSMSRAGAGVTASLHGQMGALSDCSGIEAAAFACGDAWSRDDRQRWSGLALTVGEVRGPAAFAYSPALAPAIGAFRPSVVHRHGLWTYASVAAARSAGMCGGKVVVSPHGMLEPWALANARRKKAIARFLFEGRALRKADCIHALNETELANIREAGLTNPVCVIANGVELPTPQDLDLAETPAQTRAGVRTLLFLGRLHPKKGLEALVRGWRVFAGAHDGAADWRLRIVGWSDDGYDGYLKALARDCGVADTITVNGPVFGRARWREYGRSDAFVLPSLSEGLPMAVLEAWAAGLPVIMTEACNLAVGFARQAAIRTDPDPQAIGRSLSELAGLDDFGRRRLGDNGRALVADSYSWERVAGSLCDVYRWLVTGGTAPATVETGRG